VGRKNLKAIVFSRPARLLLLEKERGGTDASVARVGDCGLLQAAGVLGGGEHLPATATAGARAPTASASNSRRRPALLGVGVPLVRRLAKVLVDRETRDGIHDRDGCYGAVFDQRVRALGITQIRTPFRSPQANSIAERWVGSLRRECLDYVFIFNERHLRAVLAEYVQHFNRWRPHHAIGQRAPCAVELPICKAHDAEVIGEPVLGGLHHVYHLAA
jgi:hypothetical protein